MTSKAPYERLVSKKITLRPLIHTTLRDCSYNTGQKTTRKNFPKKTAIKIRNIEIGYHIRITTDRFTN